VEGNWWHNYQTTKKKGKLHVHTSEEIQNLDERIPYFGIDLFFVGISHILARSPHEGYIMILCNCEHNYYKEIAIFFGEVMKRD
jgi:hypothetical protein